MKIHLCFAALAAGWALACELDDPAGADESREGSLQDGLLDDIDAGGEPVYTYAGWTSYTSEENPPIGCDPGSLVSRFGCSGSYCDNVRLYCEPTGASAGAPAWTSFFSEEGYNYRECPWRHWLSGVSCRGSYCDNIALQCTYYPNLAPSDCYWTGWVSEEGGGELAFGSGYYARGVQCSGSYCDNKRFYVCRR